MVTSSVFACVRITSVVLRINIPNNVRHIIVAEGMRDRCVMISEATAKWRNAYDADLKLLAIGHRNRNALLPRLVLADCGRVAELSTKGIVSLTSISWPPALFLSRTSRTAAHPGIFRGLFMSVRLVS